MESSAMDRRFAANAMLIAAFFCSRAFAQEATYAFKVENTSGKTAMVTLDGRQVCAMAAGESCTITVKDTNRHAYAFSLAGGGMIGFDPGNLEMTDICKIDARGAHCTDPAGSPTN